jgi:hypothetical protein
VFHFPLDSTSWLIIEQITRREVYWTNWLSGCYRTYPLNEASIIRGSSLLLRALHYIGGIHHYHGILVSLRPSWNSWWRIRSHTFSSIHHEGKANPCSHCSQRSTVNWSIFSLSVAVFHILAQHSQSTHFPSWKTAVIQCRLRFTYFTTRFFLNFVFVGITR